ncbi:DUF1349 domain-containing protein [Tropicimonas marinistellae]|uniref:DUF1349 domain-containing protein n=1 Tax=Tropicimonas marinistellae TaxID=1739787 RepID=UPI00082E4086|nr:DUF1349 domain-containing protein [Tropicimonas marinistellae]
MFESVPFDQGAWLNPPPVCRVQDAAMEIETAEQTDFWRRTHYGFERASGHALLFDVPARFVVEQPFTGRFQSRYEQAGLLLWEDETRWIKAGVEFADGRPNLAVVVTDGHSDWSMAPADAETEDWTIRLTATDSATILHARGRGAWQILRVTDFVARGARVGPMACSPLSAGLAVRFSPLRVGPVPEDPLYIGG